MIIGPIHTCYPEASRTARYSAIDGRRKGIRSLLEIHARIVFIKRTQPEITRRLIRIRHTISEGNIEHERLLGDEEGEHKKESIDKYSCLFQIQLPEYIGLISSFHWYRFEWMLIGSEQTCWSHFGYRKPSFRANHPTAVAMNTFQSDNQGVD